MTDREFIAAVLDVCDVEWVTPLSFRSEPDYPAPVRGGRFGFYFDNDGALDKAWYYDTNGEWIRHDAK